jgi:hypothetical protein
MFGTEFYPTPRDLANRLISKLTRRPGYVLDPQAGAGALLEAVSRRWDIKPGVLKAIEIDPDLCAILSSKGFTVTDSDWLKYSEMCHFDTIVSNPPFSNAATHVKKMLEWADDTEIAFIYPATNLTNLFTEERRWVAERIQELNAEVEFVKGAFKEADRSTDVEVAIIHVYVPRKLMTEKLSGFVHKTDEPVFSSIPINQLPARIDVLGNLEHYFNEATKAYYASLDYLDESKKFIAAMRLGAESETIKTLPVSVNGRRAEWLNQFRKDSWKMVLDRPEFFKVLDKLQREEFYRDIEKAGGISFTAANIRATLEAILLKRGQYFEQSAVNVFKAITQHHEGNKESEGWKTNKSYEVPPKLIFPYGVSYDSKFDSFDSWRTRDGVIDIANDLDRILCVLTGEDFEKCDIVAKAMKAGMEAYNAGKYNGTPQAARVANLTTSSRFFSVIRIYKKGTLHLKWRSDDLRREFNALTQRGFKWIVNEEKR